MNSITQTLLGRYASLESDVPPEDDLDVEAPIEGADETGAQLDGENIVEGDLVEAAEDEADIDEAEGEAGDLEETADALESYLMAAHIGKSKGGWTSDEAAAYGLGIDHSLRRIGLSADHVVPALESFGTPRERLESTASVESKIKDALVAIWDAIKRGVNKVMAFVRKWYTKIFDGASRLKKRANAIRKQAENTTGTAKDKKLRTSTLSSLHISKAMPSASTLVTAIDGLREATKTLTSGRMESTYEATLENVVKIITDLAETEGGISPSDALAKVVQVRSSPIFTVDLAIAKSKGSSDDIKRIAPVIESQNSIVDLHMSSELPGGKKLAHLTIAGSKGDLDNGSFGRNVASSMKVAGKVLIVDASTKKVELDTSKEVTILTPSEVVSIADSVADFCQVIVDYKLGFAKYETKNSAALNKVDGVVRKAKGEDKDKADRDRGEFVRGLATGLGSMIRNRGTSITNVIGYGLGVSRSALVFSVQSLHQYRD